VANGVRATRKLFFALWPTDDIRTVLEAASRSVLRTSSGRAVPARHYHVTLAFLGDQPAEQVDRLTAMASVAPPAFELVLDRLGHWRRSQVLWIGPRECPAGLTVLVGQIRTKLEVLGISHDRRDFRPHLTLARKVRTLPELEAPPAVHWPVSDFVLVESVAAPDGPAYEVIHRFAPDSPSGVFSGGSRHDPNQG